ncbi:hypothetical protein BH09ACT7_BH09ACT7_52020 [soil metagenome]
MPALRTRHDATTRRTRAPGNAFGYLLRALQPNPDALPRTWGATVVGYRRPLAAGLPPTGRLVNKQATKENQAMAHESLVIEVGETPHSAAGVETVTRCM